MLSASLQPTFYVVTKLLWQKLTAPGMLVVVAVNLSVTLETDWNCILNIISTTIGSLNNMVGLNLGAAEAMADTTSPVNIHKKLGDLITVKSQS